LPSIRAVISTPASSITGSGFRNGFQNGSQVSTLKGSTLKTLRVES
jgi:hypothetical protein